LQRFFAATVDPIAARAHAQARLLAALRLIQPGPALPESCVRAALAAADAEGAALLLPGFDGQLRLIHGEGSPVSPLVSLGALRERLSHDATPAVLDGPEALPSAAGALCLLPMRHGARVVGALVTLRLSRDFTASEARELDLLAQHAALALDAAQLERRLASSDRLVSLGQLAAGVAHELKTPLTCIAENAAFAAQSLEALQKKGAIEATSLTQARESLADTLDAAARMRELVRDIGSLASADETTRLPFDLNAAVRAAVRMTEAELRGRARVTLRLAPYLPIVGSLGRVTQVFVNLLVNAAHALKRSPELQGQIVISTRMEGGRAIAEVADNGSGIAKDLQARIFEPFFTTKSPDQGTGLGLFLCRDIARRHGGELRVRSAPRRGATFALALPVAQPAEASEEPLALVELRSAEASAKE
jgi:signal transduction histidine kinase